MLSKYSKMAVIAAVAGACGYASAATTVISGRDSTLPISVEGIVAAGANAEIQADVTVNIDTLLTPNADYVTVDISNAAFHASTGLTAPSLTCLVGGAGSTDNVVFNLDTVRSNFVRARYVSISSGLSETNASCTFSNLDILHASITGSVGLTGTVKNINSTVETDRNQGTAASTQAFSTASQISSVVVTTPFNGEIDFQNSLGYGFTTDDGALIAGDEDTLTLSINTRDTQLSLATGLTFGFALNAESGKAFAFLDQTCDASSVLNRTGNLARAAVDDGASGNFVGAVTIGSSCQTLTVSGTFTPNTASAQVLLSVGHVSATPTAGNSVIEPQTMSITGLTLQQGAVSRLPSNQAALLPGAWTSNGATVQIPYMPINTTAGASKIDPVVILSNRSTATGSITATVRDESGNLCEIGSSVLGSIGPRSTKSIGGDIRDAIAGSTCATLGGVEKVSITLVVTLPSGSTEVYSGYTVGGASRVTVVNSSNGRP